MDAETIKKLRERLKALPKFDRGFSWEARNRYTGSERLECGGDMASLFKWVIDNTDTLIDALDTQSGRTEATSEIGEPGPDAMRVIDPEQWEPCSPAYLAAGGNCACAPRVWDAKSKNHWHPKLTLSGSRTEAMRKALEGIKAVAAQAHRYRSNVGKEAMFLAVIEERAAEALSTSNPGDADG